MEKAIPRPPELVTEAEHIARETAELCWKLLRLKKAPLQLRTGWEPEVWISWSASRAKSRGSGRRISLALLRHTPTEKAAGTRFKEYASFAADPTIGTTTGPDWRDGIRILVAHEMAHSAQYAPRRRDCAWQETFKKIHGNGFRRLYAYLRHELGLNEKIRSEGGLIGKGA